MRQHLSLVTDDTAPAPIRFGSALVRSLIECASRNTGLLPREITGWGRSRDLVWIRWAIALVAREQGRSLPQIGGCLNRDHTTILHGLRACRGVNDRDFEELVRRLRDEVDR